MGGNQGSALRSWREVFSAAPISAVVATWFGAGFLPFAPGTWGSLLGIPFVEAAFRLGGVAALVGFALVVSLGGIPAAGAVSRLRADKDPSQVVVDEVAGQAIALLPVYVMARAGSPARFWVFVFLAFLLFRVVDVLKPGPVRRAESLPGGLGVMADDLLGGLFVALVLAAVLAIVR
jgi:phosphatidylglycerophosphatase A